MLTDEKKNILSQALLSGQAVAYGPGLLQQILNYLPLRWHFVQLVPSRPQIILRLVLLMGSLTIYWSYLLCLIFVSFWYGMEFLVAGVQQNTFHWNTQELWLLIMMIGLTSYALLGLYLLPPRKLQVKNSSIREGIELKKEEQPVLSALLKKIFSSYQIISPKNISLTPQASMTLTTTATNPFASKEYQLQIGIVYLSSVSISQFCQTLLWELLPYSHVFPRKLLSWLFYLDNYIQRIGRPIVLWQVILGAPIIFPIILLQRCSQKLVLPIKKIIKHLIAEEVRALNGAELEQGMLEEQKKPCLEAQKKAWELWRYFAKKFQLTTDNLPGLVSLILQQTDSNQKQQEVRAEYLLNNSEKLGKELTIIQFPELAFLKQGALLPQDFLWLTSHSSVQSSVFDISQLPLPTWSAKRPLPLILETTQLSISDISKKLNLFKNSLAQYQTLLPNYEQYLEYQQEKEVTAFLEQETTINDFNSWDEEKFIELEKNVGAALQCFFAIATSQELASKLGMLNPDFLQGSIYWKDRLNILATWYSVSPLLNELIKDAKLLICLQKIDSPTHVDFLQNHSSQMRSKLKQLYHALGDLECELTDSWKINLKNFLLPVPPGEDVASLVATIRLCSKRSSLLYPLLIKQLENFIPSLEQVLSLLSVNPTVEESSFHQS